MPKMTDQELHCSRIAEESAKNCSVHQLKEAIAYAEENNFNLQSVLPTIMEILYCIYDNDFHSKETDSSTRIADDAAYEYLDYIFPLTTVSDAYEVDKNSSAPQPLSTPLFYAGKQNDCRMLRFLFEHGINKNMKYNDGLYDAFLQDYLYLHLPDWGMLASYEGDQRFLFSKIEEHAARINTSAPEVLRLLIELGFESKLKKLPLKYSKVELLPDFHEACGNDPCVYDYSIIIDGVDMNEVNKKECTNEDSELIKALCLSGDFWLFTCGCGEPWCAGIWEPVTAVLCKDSMRWFIPYPVPMRYIAFKREPVIDALTGVMDSVIQHLLEKGYDKKLIDMGYFPHGPSDTSFGEVISLAALLHAITANKYEIPANLTAEQILYKLSWVFGNRNHNALSELCHEQFKYYENAACDFFIGREKYISMMANVFDDWDKRRIFPEVYFLPVKGKFTSLLIRADGSEFVYSITAADGLMIEAKRYSPAEFSINPAEYQPEEE